MFAHMAAALVVLSGLTDGPVTGGSGGLADLGPVELGHAGHNCIPPEQREQAEAMIAEYYRLHGPVLPVEPLGYSSRATALYDFWPQAGVRGGDLVLANYVDLNPAGGATEVRDPECTAYTYDGHLGHDCIVRSFSEQLIGVPVFAIKPGTVVARQDGYFDMQTAWTNTPANFVILDHGNNHRTYYWHLKNGSVAVTQGQTVAAGQQLGLTASSGYSSWPHLHLEIYKNGLVNEPFTGACHVAPSGWAAPEAIDRTLRVSEFAFSRIAPNTVQPPPHRRPSTGQLALNDPVHWFWAQIQNVPTASNFRVRYYRPDGGLSYDSGTLPFNNPRTYQAMNPYWTWNIAEMHTIPGTWRMELDINGVLLVNAPVEVSETVDPAFNRPPAALQGLSFEPASPSADDAIFCRVATSLVHDDPDYEVVKYEYVWTVDGVEVRRITSAAHSDAIRAGLAGLGAEVRCTVTPKDALLSAPASTATVTVGCGTPDFNGDGDFGTDQDIEAFFACLSGSCCPACFAGGADFNRDGDVGTDQDIESFFRVLAGGSC